MDCFVVAIFSIPNVQNEIDENKREILFNMSNECLASALHTIYGMKMRPFP